MSNHHILAAVSRRIRSILWQGIKEDEATQLLIHGEQSIKIGAPDPGNPDARMFIWLYQIRPNKYQADLPRRHITDVAEPAPLPLDLWYMITTNLPGGDQDGADLVLLARTMQIMAANTHIAISEPGFEENLRVMLEDPPTQEQVLLWRALRKSMQLAVFYQISAVRIDPYRNSSRAAAPAAGGR